MVVAEQVYDMCRSADWGLKQARLNERMLWDEANRLMDKLDLWREKGMETVHLEILASHALKAANEATLEVQEYIARVT